MIWEILIAALVGGLVGGGAISAVGYRALKDRLVSDLKEIFARRDELDNVGSRVNGLVTVATMAKDVGDANSDAIIRLQEGEK